MSEDKWEKHERRDTEVEVYEINAIVDANESQQLNLPDKSLLVEIGLGRLITRKELLQLKLVKKYPPENTQEMEKGATRSIPQHIGISQGCYRWKSQKVIQNTVSGNHHENSQTTTKIIIDGTITYSNSGAQLHHLCNS